MIPEDLRLTWSSVTKRSADDSSSWLCFAIKQADDTYGLGVGIPLSLHGNEMAPQSLPVGDSAF